jgi:vacuolar protein sorting-associated protein 72
VSDLDSNSSDGVDSGDSGGSSMDSGSSDDSRPRRKSKKFVVPPPRSLPQRTTRGQRMGDLGVPDDDDADNEFWNQEFFAEEAADERYETESEPEDRFDADFMDSEEEDDDEDVEEEEDRNEFQARKKKILRPPGQAPAKKRPLSEPKKRSATKAAGSPAVIPERTMSVRSSTKKKVEDAKVERKFLEESKVRKVYKKTDHKQLTQAELLAEAARTAIENTRSLMYMEAVEEENKRKATNTGSKYAGPMISVKSVKGEDGEEHTNVIVKHMALPDFMLPQSAPEKVQKDICPITKTIAKYRDPLTGTPYSTLEAFRAIRSGMGRK